jgi:hypothetical protein
LLNRKNKSADQKQQGKAAGMYVDKIALGEEESKSTSVLLPKPVMQPRKTGYIDSAINRAENLNNEFSDSEDDQMHDQSNSGAVFSSDEEEAKEDKPSTTYNNPLDQLDNLA